MEAYCVNLIPPPRRLCFIWRLSVFLSVCLSVSNFAKRLLIKSVYFVYFCFILHNCCEHGGKTRWD